MNTVISIFLAAIIVVNNWVGTTVSVRNNVDSSIAISQELIQADTEPNNTSLNSAYLMSNSLSDPEPLQCNTSSTVSYYLGPVIPQHTELINPSSPVIGNSSNSGIKGVITTDYYVGAIFKYDIDPDPDGPGPLTNDVYGYRFQYDYDTHSRQLWYFNSKDNFGKNDNPDSGSYCSSIKNPLDNKPSAEICNQVCPGCQYFDGATDPKAIGCKRTDPACVNGGLEVHGGWGLTVPYSHDMALGGHFYDIQLIYYGIPKNLPPRSKLSDNEPKNTANGDPRECEASRCDDAATSSGDPVDVLTGNFNYSYTDLSLKTIAGTLSLQRSYASLATDTDQHPTDISPGWSHNQDTRLLFEGDQVWFKAHTLNQYRFDVVGEHEYDPFNGVLAELIFNNGQYILTTTSQSVYVFDGNGRLLTWTNERGYGFIYTYSGGNLDRVTEPVSGRYLQFNYLAGILQSVSDSAGRQVSYAYDGSGDLSGVTDVRSNTWGYQYDSQHRVTTVLAPGTPPDVLLTIAYDAEGRAYEQHDGTGNLLTHIEFNPDGSSTSHDPNGIPTDYTPDCRGVVTRTAFPGTASLPGYYVDRAYDHNFNLSSVRGADDDKVTSLRWSMDGANLLEMTDQAGYTTTFTYDVQNHVTRVDAPEEEWMSFNYTGPLITSTTESSSLGDVTTSYTYTTSLDAPQPVNLLKTTTDALGKVTGFEYDPLGQLIKITDADLNETLFAYDATGQVTSITDALGRMAQVEYDPSGAVTKQIENYDPAHLPNEDDQYNLSASYEYDLQGRLSITRDTLNQITSTTLYDDAGRIHQILDATSNPVTYVYNQDGSVDSVTIAPDFQTSYDYDELGRVTAVHDSLDQLVTGYAYNPDDTLAAETDAAGLVTSYIYDALHRITQVTDNADRSISTSYDAYGDVTTITDTLGRVTKYEYSDPGRLTRVIENYLTTTPLAEDPNTMNVTTEYTYDILGNLLAIQDANDHVSIYSYDNLYRLDTITDPISHVTGYGYDALGNQVSITRPDGNITTFAYDLVNRLTGIDYPGGTDPDVSFQFNELGQLTGMDDSLGHTAWEYDLLGQPTLITDPYDQSIAYAYDALGNRTQLNYPGGRSIHYQYDANGLLEHVLDGVTPLVDYSYDSAGRLASAAYANGVESTYGYDISSQLTGISHQLNGDDLSLYEYTYDLVGNLIQTQESSNQQNYSFLPFIDRGPEDGLDPFGFNYLDPEGLDGAYPAPDESIPDGMDAGYPAPVAKSSFSSDSFWILILAFFADILGNDPVSAMSEAEITVSDHVITYTYDALDRLKTANYSTGESYAYSYDPVGNRTSQTASGITTTYNHDAANRLTSVNGVNYTWDDNGSLLNDGLMNYSYDPAGRLAGIISAYGNYQFGYDGLGNRYSQTIDGVTTSYTLDLAAGLTTVLREGTTTYLYGLGLIGQETGGVLEIALADRLGSLRQLVADDGQVSLRMSYDPFGNPLEMVGDGESALGYTGEQTDESGLVYLRARYYSPETGRFISADPFPGLLSLPATQNVYPYGINNPLSYTDPSGEILPFIAAGLAGGIIGGGISMAMQCLGSSDMDSCMKCMDWGKVGTAAAAGAVAGFVGFGVGLAFAATGTGLLSTMIGGFYAGLFSGQAYRATELVLTGRLDQAGSVLFQPKDLYQDGMIGALGSAVGYGVSHLFQNLLPPKLSPQEIGKAAEQLVADKLPIDLDRQFVPGVERNRYYDGVLRINSKNYIEIKTSTRGTVYGTKFNRSQALFDYNYKIRSGKPPLWIFVNSKPSSPFADLLNGYGLPFFSLWE